MYKVINIGGEDYKLEYTIEASLYGDCVSKLMGIMSDVEVAEGEEDIKKLFAGISNIPETALTMFYAGLLEAHGTHPDGDGKVPNIHTAKRLLAQYIREHLEDETGNFYGIMGICISQMGEDGFFKLTGMESIMNPPVEKKKPKKVPQDHKKPLEK